MADRITCEVEGCVETAVRHCANCGRALCRQHTVADYSHLPGGQRPYCVDCDAERRQLYQNVRTRGGRAILWSGAGAIAGSVIGYSVSALITPDSFAHTVTTDVGFVVGLAAALLVALARSNA